MVHLFKHCHVRLFLQSFTVSHGFPIPSYSLELWTPSSFQMWACLLTAECWKSRDHAELRVEQRSLCISPSFSVLQRCHIGPDMPAVRECLAAITRHCLTFHLHFCGAEMPHKNTDVTPETRSERFVTQRGKDMLKTPPLRLSPSPAVKMSHLPVHLISWNYIIGRLFPNWHFSESFESVPQLLVWGHYGCTERSRLGVLELWVNS